MHSNITHSYEVLNIPKINTRRFVNYTLSFDGFILNCQIKKPISQNLNLNFY